MASKIFMGDMPELMEKVLNNLNDDFYSLYGATLHKLVLLAPRFIEIKPDIIKSFEQNAQFFSQLQDLTIDIESFLSIENTIALLNIFIKHTTKISSLKLGGIFSNHEPQLFHILIRFIKSQEQLRKFCFAGEHYHTNFNGLLSALESQKNSLQEVIVENYGYSAEFDVLKICKNLETLRMRNEFDYPILFLNCKISTLEIYSFKIDGSTIVQILEHSGNLLQRLKLNNNDFKILNEFLLLEAIKSFCPNITYLSISKIGFSTQILEIIGNLQKLQFLTLKFFVDISEKELKIRVKQFAEILPLTLQYLDLINNSWLMPYLDIFLNHCNVPLNKLSIYQLDNEKNIEALIEFCKRNRTLNYFSMFDHWKLDKSFTKKLEAYTALESYDRFVVHC
ncbi:hypothetical protein F8M41_000748 [Gigaspora margarita]|uniref:Uncharacterized protein n=1 Tax=Gigaspora margarita TaxID=4874 RepID=A0A8H4AZD4_GIGMA|nr:hypothetical protein F8M41_000748 [Gigaspora margarita]